MWCGARNGRSVASRPLPMPAADPGQSPGEHGLPRARWADHQEVVAAGGGDLESALGVLLAAHVGQVRAGAGRRLIRIGDGRTGRLW